MQIMATSLAVCENVRCGSRSRLRNAFDRASELETAAATPSSTSSVMRIRLLETLAIGGLTPLLYRFKAACTRWNRPWVARIQSVYPRPPG
jgi:hypothetical protein